MNDAVIALWTRVLQAVPGSRLLLKTKQLDEAAVRQSVLERFGVHGIGFDRLILEGKSPRKQYFSAYNRVDIALDPFPFTGGTTSADNLWMGVPVLTLAGDRFISRQGLGLMMNAGLAEWVAEDADDYVRRAVLHAADLERLSALRQQLRGQILASPLCDAERFAMNLHNALRGMWQQWCKEQ
jgi:predicted O-linked N-acetylglucosamine transferase (SPINDLY family)